MPNFTPQQVEEVLQQFFDTTGTRQYIGARYVPIIGRKGEDTCEWDNSKPYEPLTIVTYLGNSYTSCRYVPANVQITNTEYWIMTGNYNAQIDAYRMETERVQDTLDDIAEMLPSGNYSAQHTVSDAMDEKADELKSELTPFPTGLLSKYGVIGQVLTTLGNGSTQWADPVVPSDAQAEEVITEWLDNHPEATTTVQDGSITDAKIASQPYTSNNARKSVFHRLPIDITQITDLNDILGTGYVELVSGATYEHCPVPATAPRALMVFQDTNVFFLQIFIDILRGVYYTRWKSANGWSAWYKFEDEYAYRGHTFENPDATDADDFLTSGFWLVNNTYTPEHTAHVPSPTGLLLVYRMIDSGQCKQIFFSQDDGNIYFRYRSSNPPTWKEWINLTHQIPFMGYAPLNEVGDTFDANSIFKYGYWRIISNEGTVSHLPSDIGTFFSYPTESETEANLKQMTQFFMDWTTNHLWVRRYSGNIWRGWIDITKEVANVPPYRAASKPFTGVAGANSGETLRVMSYNVCQYDNDSTTDISEDQLSRLKQMVMRANCELLFWQESTATINDNGSNDKSAEDYVFKPVYPYTFRGQTANTISSRQYDFISTGTSEMYPSSSGESGSRYVHATITLASGKVLSVYNVHPKAGDDSESLAIRARQWQDLADILDADQATYKIVCGDFNTRPEDYQTFDTIFSDYNRANGGYMGWYDTTGRYKAIYGTEYPNDNIIVSSNIVFNYIDVYYDWYSLLYSDHVPIVAELCLH